MNNPSAQKARDVAVARHKSIAATWKFVSIVAILSNLALGAIAYHSHTWRNDTPPARQKLEVVTHGWWDPKKGWCSYETGEKMEVNGWRSWP